MTYLSDELYSTITNSIPIVCVDIIPVRKTGSEWELGTIIRATGPEKDKLAILGGRIQHNETITDAIKRHLTESLEVDRFALLPSNDINRPFYIQQYFHQSSLPPPDGFDPTKHAIALTYLIEISDVLSVQGEASDFRWINQTSIPKNFGYNQQVVIEAAFSFLK